MRWYPIKAREAALLLVVFLMSGIFAHLQQYFIAPSLLPFTYVFVLFLLMLAFFPAARPEDPPGLARFLSVLLGVLYAALIIVREIIIRHNYSWSSVIVLAGVVLSPLVAGYIYNFAARPRSGR